MKTKNKNKNKTRRANEGRKHKETLLHLLPGFQNFLEHWNTILLDYGASLGTTCELPMCDVGAMGSRGYSHLILIACHSGQELVNPLRCPEFSLALDALLNPVQVFFLISTTAIWPV